ncbi:large subunit ribosomal protein L24e [Geosmithia morbida]|uniref:Large subunit ribosomal protein L24e n=1 Tax=Geosmithia morbida TaxID=1094350 RepID=A0A9P5D7L1_9HYPO|nr:large subunit ribosomal protein L24e [Geosmithia morbida]KAF4124609.1 large subunit ribosomal protein L24e [Geosmithia morbida]
MRTYDDVFSGQRIYPGKGKVYVRGDSKVFRFQSGKSESLFLQRKNPRRIAWTRGIVGASLDVIKEKRSQRPEARSAARQQAIKDSKEKKAASQAAKKADKAKNAAASKGQTVRGVSKQGAKGAAPKPTARTR